MSKLSFGLFFFHRKISVNILLSPQTTRPLRTAACGSSPVLTISRSLGGFLGPVRFSILSLSSSSVLKALCMFQVGTKDLLEFRGEDKVALKHIIHFAKLVMFIIVKSCKKGCSFFRCVKLRSKHKMRSKRCGPRMRGRRPLWRVDPLFSYTARFLKLLNNDPVLLPK